MNGSDAPTNPAPRFSESPTSADSKGPHTDAQVRPPTHLLSDLPDVPGYAVAREIARGGMGAVYRAHDPKLDRPVAIKVMHPGQDGARFVIESKVTAQLTHPGIPPVYDLGELPGGAPFLVMKLVEGHTFADELKTPDRGAELLRRLGAFEAICQTVGFAHARGFVHRDLKPGNVMIGSFGEVLVMDWGLAKRIGAAQTTSSAEDTDDLGNPRGGETPVSTVKGTPAYMAPEQARGEEIDARTDVFALGGILAALLTGRPPFPGTSAGEAVQKAIRADLSACYASLDGCGADAELIALAKRCLAADRAERFADGKAVAEVVAAYRAGVEERLRRAERDRAVSEAEAREQRKRRQVQLALLAALALLLAAGGAFAWWREKTASDQRLVDERAATELRVAEMARDTEARNKAEQARAGVSASRQLAADLRKQSKFADADKALAQAAALARSGAPELLAAVEGERRDLALVVKLDDIRYRKWVWVSEAGGKGEFDTKIAPPEYRKAFAARGLDLAALDPADAVRLITGSEVKEEVVAAVDDWALYEKDERVRNRLLDVARKADPGPWTDRLRDPAVRADKAALEKLVAETDFATVRPGALCALAELMRRQGLEPAVLLTAARTRHPTDFELNFAYGRRFVSVGGLQLGPYEVARALRPEVPAAWLNLGAALASRKDYDEAIAALRKGIELDPTSARAHNNLGVVLVSRRDFAGAAAELRRAIELDRTFAKAYSNLGIALTGMKDYAGAFAEFQRAADLAPDSPAALSNLGLALAERGRIDEAIAAHKRAIAIDPTFFNGHVNLGAALAAKEDFEGARAALERALKLDPSSAPAHTNLGYVLWQLDKDDAAIGAYRRAIALDPKYSKAHSALGTILANNDQFDAAIAACREAIRLDPNDVLAYATLGTALQGKNDLDGAIAAYLEVLKRNPKHPRVLDNIAAAYGHKGNFREAIVYARRAIAVADPTSAGPYATLGQALWRTGDIPGARAALTEAARRDKQWADLLAQLPPPPQAPPPREVKR